MALFDLQRDENVFTLTMDAGENRWNTTFVRELDAVLDQVSASTGPVALVTTASSPKFFSNGIDLDWIQASAAAGSNDVALPGGERKVFGVEFMALMARLMTFEVPTVAAINGHAFGAGLMAALCHDVRIMRSDRGFLCANELLIGMQIPLPELALFHHKIPQNAFFETVQLARRWTGPDALAAGIVQRTASSEDLLAVAQETARQLAPLAANRSNYGAQKERLFGENAALRGAHGPAYMLRHAADYH